MFALICAFLTYSLCQDVISYLILKEQNKIQSTETETEE